MSTYLARLKQLENEKNFHYATNSEPSKPSKGTSEPFEGTGAGYIEKKIIDAEGFAERAAIYEFDAGYPRHEAERLAYLEVTKWQQQSQCGIFS